MSPQCEPQHEPPMQVPNASPQCEPPTQVPNTSPQCKAPAQPSTQPPECNPPNASPQHEPVRVLEEYRLKGHYYIALLFILPYSILVRLQLPFYLTRSLPSALIHIPICSFSFTNYYRHLKAAFLNFAFSSSD